MDRGLSVAFLLLFSAPAFAQERPAQPQDLTEMSLEDLMKLKVTSVSKHEQPLLDAPAAVAVLRSDDLRRGGATSLAEGLRMVPGVQVARIDANKWAVSVRGFNELFSNKLLVVNDGRSVYSPLFSGVHWAEQDAILQDLDRVEVIRGPGATLWGANAVNGVVNIMSKPARETQGGLVVLGGGTEERFLTAARWGGKIDEDAHYRIYARYADRDDGHKGDDDWSTGRAGFRADWAPAPGRRLTLQGEYYRNRQGTRLQTESLTAPPTIERDPWPAAGGFLLARWEEGAFVAKAYVDTVEHDFTGFEESRDIADLELQHRFALGDFQQITWGAGYRWNSDDVKNTFGISLDPDHDADHLASAFVQDEIRLVRDALTLTLGSKFEYFSYTGFEYQPGARLSWTPHERHALWASAARAVRTPSRVENDGIINIAVLPGPTPITILGTHRYGSEEMIAFELGYRVLPAPGLSFDLALFYNEYDDLRTAEPKAFAPSPPFPPATATLSILGNKMAARSYGAELAAGWQAADGLRLTGAFTFLRVNRDLDSDSGDFNAEASEASSPRGQVYLRASWDPVKEFRADLVGRYAGRVSSNDIDSYVEMDARVAWDILPHLEAAIVGQNLLHDEHPEGLEGLFGIQASEVERGVYASLTWRF